MKMLRYLVTQPPGCLIPRIGKLILPGEVLELYENERPPRSAIGLSPEAEEKVEAEHLELQRRESLSPEEKEKENQVIRAAQRKAEHERNRRAHAAVVEGFKEKLALQAGIAQAAKDAEALSRHQEKLGLQTSEGQTLSEFAAGGGRAEPTVSEAPGPATSTEQASHIPSGGVTVRKRAADTKV